MRGRIIPRSEVNRGPATYNPDAPQIERVPLRKLRVVFPSSLPVNPPKGSVIEAILKDFGRGVSEGQRITPCTTQPLFESRYTPIRGGRVIGGGTSREALRKARRKSRKRA